MIRLISFFLTISFPLYGFTLHNEQPKKMHVNYAINQLINVDYVNHTFEIDFYFQQYWKVDSILLAQKLLKDNRILTSTTSLEEEDLDWIPRNEFINSISLEKRQEINYSYINGFILLDTRYKGVFFNQMILNEFPFDNQNLSILLEDFSEPISQLTHVYGSPFDSSLTKEEDTLLIPSQKAFETKVDFSEFILNPLVKSIKKTHTYEFTSSPETYSQLEFVLNVSRKKVFYLTKVISISLLIVLMSWIVFFMDPSDLSGRTAFSITVFLALTGHNFIVNSLLPKISYLTTMDYIMLGTNVLVFFTVIESFFVARIALNSTLNKAKKIDQYSFYASVFFFLIISLFIFLKSTFHVS